MSMDCEEAHYLEDTMTYNITLTVELDSAFTPAIIEVINYVELYRFRSNEEGLIQSPQLQITVNQTVLYNEIMSSEPGEQFYGYIVSGVREAYVML